MLFQYKLLKDKNVNINTCTKTPQMHMKKNIGDYQKLPHSSWFFKQTFFKRMNK